MALSLATVGGKITASFINAIIGQVNLQGATRIIPTITSTGGTVTVSSTTGEITGTGAITQLNVTIPSATNYKTFIVTYFFRGGTSGTYTVKLMSAGTPEATASAHRNKQQVDATSVAVATGTAWTFSPGSRLEHYRKATIMQLPVAKPTTWHEVGGSSDASASEGNISSYARHTVSTALDGFRFDLSSMGTMTDLSVTVEGLA